MGIKYIIKVAALKLILKHAMSMLDITHRVCVHRHSLHIVK